MNHACDLRDNRYFLNDYKRIQHAFYTAARENPTWCEYFGDWLREALPKIPAMEDFIVPPSVICSWLFYFDTTNLSITDPMEISIEKDPCFPFTTPNMQILIFVDRLMHAVESLVESGEVPLIAVPIPQEADEMSYTKYIVKNVFFQIMESAVFELNNPNACNELEYFVQSYVDEFVNWVILNHKEIGIVDNKEIERVQSRIWGYLVETGDDLIAPGRNIIRICNQLLQLVGRKISIMNQRRNKHE